MTTKTIASLRASVKTLEHMAAHCEEQQRLQGIPDAFVTFVLPGVFADRRQRHLVLNRGPLGDVVGTTPDGKSSVVGWSADKLLAFLLPHLIEVQAMLAAWEKQP
jgi:hypothetical protein